MRQRVRNGRYRKKCRKKEEGRKEGRKEARNRGRSRSGWRMVKEGKGRTMEWGRAETGPGLLGKCVTAYWSSSSTHNPLRQHLSPIVERRWLALGWGNTRREGGKEGRTAGGQGGQTVATVYFHLSSFPCSPSFFCPRYENARVRNEAFLSLFIRPGNYIKAFSQPRARETDKEKEVERGDIFLHSFSSLH